MRQKRRDFLKQALLGSSAAVLGTIAVSAQEAKTGTPKGSNGVVVGHSPKKEILYKKTSHWREYYRVAP